jgi:hypothetical protein
LRRYFSIPDARPGLDTIIHHDSVTGNSRVEDSHLITLPVTEKRLENVIGFVANTGNITLAIFISISLSIPSISQATECSATSSLCLMLASSQSNNNLSMKLTWSIARSGGQEQTRREYKSKHCLSSQPTFTGFSFAKPINVLQLVNVHTHLIHVRVKTPSAERCRSRAFPDSRLHYGNALSHFLPVPPPH